MKHFRLIPFLIRQKVYIDTANLYASYLRYPTMVAILLGVFHVHVTGWMVLIGVPFLILSFRMFGWLMLKIGAFQAEAARHSYLNPYNKEVLDRLEKLEEQAKEIRQREIADLVAILQHLDSVTVQLNAISEKHVRIIRLLQK